MLVVVLVVAALPRVEVSAKGTPVRFFGSGYACIRSKQLMLVDTESRPTCASSVGISLGVLPRNLLPQASQRQTNGWSVSTQPIEIRGVIVNGKSTAQTVAPQPPRSQRQARSLSTVEVANFDVFPRSAITDPNVIFERLPLLAEAAPNATVRLARTIHSGGFQYGAQVRDASLTPTQRSALEAVANTERIAVRINTTAAIVLQTDCAPLPAAVSQPLGFGVTQPTSKPTWPATPSRWQPNVGACDELSQVNIVVAPIVGSPQSVLRADTDAVIDATLRVARPDT